jgi:hypothetical protein
MHDLLILFRITMKPYYYIFRVGGSHPRIKHPTLESAHTEAMRLAAQHPGDSFEILQCLATTQTINPQTFWVDEVIPPHVCAMHRIMDDTCHVCGKFIDENARAMTPAKDQANEK